METKLGERDTRGERDRSPGVSQQRFPKVTLWPIGHRSLHYTSRGRRSEGSGDFFRPIKPSRGGNGRTMEIIPERKRKFRFTGVAY